jgi:thiol-disulfide isomerase/thioredoxin
MKTIMNRKNIFNAIFIILLLVIAFVPPAKAMVIEGLMSIGFFKPSTVVNEPAAGTFSDLSGIKFKDVNGKTIDLGNLKGKVVFLNFWATWCPPCLAELSGINRLYEKFKDDPGVVFILADADGNLAKSQKFMDKKHYHLPVYAVDSQIPDVLFKGSLPTTVVFDKAGRISYNESGAANYGDANFIKFINRLKSMN